MAMHSGGAGGLRRLGAWAVQRTEPRLWVSMAGAGCLLAVTGLLLIAGDAQVGDDGDSGSTTPGILLFLLVVAAGYALMYLFREAPAASAGVTAVVLGVPPLMYFLTFDENDMPPVALEALLGLSALVWLVSYVVGPGRGRPLLLGAGLVFLWLFALQVIEDPVSSGLGDAPLVLDDPLGTGDAFGDDGADGSYDDSYDDGSYDDFGDDGDGDGYGYGEGPSWLTLGLTSVVFGAGYLGASRLLDRRGLSGTATPFVLAGHIALPLGIALLGDELQVGGTGVAFVIAGGLVAWAGALSGRRVTTIIGAIEVILGLYLVMGDAMEDSSATSFGTALFVLGAVVVGLVHLLHMITGETSQTTPGPSTFGGRARPVPAAAWAHNPYAPAGPQPYPGPHPGAAPAAPPAPGPPAPPPPPPPPAGGPGGSAF